MHFFDTSKITKKQKRIAEMGKIKFPISVKRIGFPKELITKGIFLSAGKIGDFVAVRPCNKEYKGKTYLGILLGELPVGCGCIYKRKKRLLEFYIHQNPAIYAPELKKIIFGCGSWWHVLKSPDDLKQITERDIKNVWYVQALKHLTKKGKAQKKS